MKPITRNITNSSTYIVGTCIEHDVIILPPESPLSQSFCYIGNDQRPFLVLSSLRLADGHIEWKLDRNHNAKPWTPVTWRNQ